MPQVSFRVKSNVPVVIQTLERLRGGFPKIGIDRLFGAAQNLVERMQKPGSKPPPHIDWDTIRQRTAFFASKGFGGGVPHVRTDKYVRGWSVVSNTKQSVTVMNSMPGAKYISGLQDGTGQSRMHAGRWTLLRDALDAVLEALPRALVEALTRFRDRGMRE
jgi:hypothetical protein